MPIEGYMMIICGILTIIALLINQKKDDGPTKNL